MSLCTEKSSHVYSSHVAGETWVTFKLDKEKLERECVPYSVCVSVHGNMARSLTFSLSQSLSRTLSISVSLWLIDKLFGKRLLQAGRYIMSHKSWMKTVPTENCDVLMTFAGPSYFFLSLALLPLIK